jgi:hypothetical protein
LFDTFLWLVLFSDFTVFFEDDDPRDGLRVAGATGRAFLATFFLLALILGFLATALLADIGLRLQDGSKGAGDYTYVKRER